MAYRAFFALPAENFSTTTGQHTNAVYGFTSMLINLLRDEEPTHVAVAFDAGRQSFRTEILPSYKGTRESSPEPFRGQVPLIKEILEKKKHAGSRSLDELRIRIASSSSTLPTLMLAMPYRRFLLLLDRPRRTSTFRADR